MKRVVFMGSPDFAVPALRRLIGEPDYAVTLVVTQPDKPQGRKQILTPPPVKQAAESAAIPVFQPNSLKTEDSVRRIADEKPDFIVVAAYGKILPQTVLDLPVYGCVNLHGSLLPKYRGAAPIQWCVINGEKETGVTTMRMDAGLDTGDILYTVKTPIGENETAGELFDRLSELCPDLLIRTLNDLALGLITPVRQNEAEATYVGMLSKSDSVIDWRLPAKQIHDLVRGLNPWPVAKTTLEGKSLKIFSGAPADRALSGEPGLVRCIENGIYVCCGEGAYRIFELQTEGGKRLSAETFLRGRRIDGCRLI